MGNDLNCMQIVNSKPKHERGLKLKTIKIDQVPQGAEGENYYGQGGEFSGIKNVDSPARGKGSIGERTAATLEDVYSNECAFGYDEVPSLHYIQYIEEYYILGQQLGQGSYGMVLKVVHRKLKIECAMKVISKAKIFEKDSRMLNLINEMNILADSSHPQVTRLYELFHDASNFYIITELLDQDLLRHIQNLQKEKMRMSELRIRSIVRQLFTSIEYLHSNDIVHRDIKLENVLIDKTDPQFLKLKLTDFGFAKKLPKGDYCSKGMGSKFYIAPEIINRDPYDHKADVWSASVIAYSLVCNNVPFAGKNFKEVLKNIQKTNIKQKLDEHLHVSQEAKDFIIYGLQINPEMRPTCEQMLNHSWMQELEIPEENLYDAQNSQQSLFMIRAGIDVSEQSFIQLSQDLIKINPKYSNDMECQNLIDNYGLLQSQQLFCSQLKGMDSRQFYKIMDQLASLK